jgi:hypothetical protein
MKSKRSDIEAITIRRAKVADADKVRYRVYSTPTEFIAVIAESALMAVKISGVRKPHKIVRDLPTEGVAIEAKKMAAIDNAAARIALPTKNLEKPEQLMTQVKDIDPNLKQLLFKPMNIGDLQSKGQNRARILPPELVNEIIEQHAKAMQTSAASEPKFVETEAPINFTAPPIPEPFAPPVAAPEPAAPELTAQERILEMANDMLPTAQAAEEVELSAEEVAKLLNG